MKEDISLTPEEVAGILKIAKNTVYELIKRGELQGYRIGRKIRVDPKDVDNYKNRGKRSESNPFQGPIEATFVIPPPQLKRSIQPVPGQELVICGQDTILDILTRHLERHPDGSRALRHHVGSFAGLLALYHGQAHMAAIHLWDGDSDTYNTPYVRRLLPGIPAVILHLACRLQGFYVAGGNPLGINGWPDLVRTDVRFINREKGCGTRVLLDEKLRLLKLDRRLISGYENEEYSHLAVASTVARRDADVGLGNEKAGLMVRGVEFIPMHKERYELVIKKDDINSPVFRALIEILQSMEFKAALSGLGDYDIRDTGKITAEI